MQSEMEWDVFLWRLLILIIYCGPALYYLPELNIFTNYRTEVYNGIPLNIEKTPFVRIGDNYYYIQAVHKDMWLQPAAGCRMINAQLASIEDKSKMGTLVKYIKERGFKSNDNFWISGNDLGAEDVFYWFSTGRQLTYSPRNVSKQMPDNYGGHENSLYKFGTPELINDANCKNVKLYICEASEPKRNPYANW